MTEVIESSTLADACGRGGLMKRFTVFMACLLLGAPALAQIGKPVSEIVELELLTSSEVVEKQKQGFINVIIANGGTEARGPHNILAGHTIMSQRTAIDAAKLLGNTLVAPVDADRCRRHRRQRRLEHPGRHHRVGGDLQGPQARRDRKPGVERLQEHLRDGRSRRRAAHDARSRRRDGQEVRVARRQRLLRAGLLPEVPGRCADVSVREEAADRRARRDDGNVEDAVPRAGAGRLRAADLQDGAVRSDGPDAGAVEGGA